MRVPLQWLREYCDPPLDTQALAARLTLTGIKEERTFRHGVSSGEHYVVGVVTEVRAHPDADRLRVCEVDVGEGEPLTIVCGAPNVASGQTVAVARPGALLADGRTLGTARLRGVSSEGMILSSRELELGDDHSGILVLDDGPPPGMALGELLPLGSDVIEFEITPNRPDCLGVYGIARETHASTGAQLRPAPWLTDPGSTDAELEGVSVVVDCPELCPRFTARAFDGVTVAPSPPWLAARLLAAGMRPISNVVDITNYVMLLTGQPLHAFDLDRIAGGTLTVRRAEPGEQLETLDGERRELDADTVIICDADGPTSIAAVMGGARSECSAQTTRLLIEAATWDGANVQRTALRLGLRSEASARFEKGLSPGQTLEAQAVASALLIELCGASVREGTIDVGGAPPPPAPIVLRAERVRALLGRAIAPERCAEILSSLEFAVDAVAEGLSVGVPHFRRGDVTREVDLIEEVARIDGLDLLPATLPPRRGAGGRLTHEQSVRRRAEDALAARGMHEIVGWSFADPALLDGLRLAPEDPLRAVVSIENPLSPATSILRPTLLGSLLATAAHNRAHGASDIALFESGTVYRTAGEGPLAQEHHALAVLWSGALAPDSWRPGASGEVDFFAARALLDALLGVLGVEWSVQRAQRPFLHAGRSAAVLAGGHELGMLGELDPLVAARWGLERTAVFELRLGELAAVSPAVVRYRPFASFPPLREDIAVVVGEQVAAADVLATVRDAAGEELLSAEIFDSYRGEQVGEGRISLAIHLEFAADDRTLTDAEVAQRRHAVAAALARRVGGELRA